MSALSGLGIIGLVVFAHYVLKERIGRQELTGAVLVLIGTAVLGFFDEKAVVQEFSTTGFLSSSAVVLGIVIIAAVTSWRTGKFIGLAWGILPGALLGVAVILGDLALIKAGNSFTGQLKNPYPYIALGLGLVAIVVTQMAFWRARAMVVVPTINSLMILTPVVLQYFTFGTTLRPISYVGVAGIIAGVVLLSATEAQGRIGGQESDAVAELAGE